MSARSPRAVQWRLALMTYDLYTSTNIFFLEICLMFKTAELSILKIQQIRKYYLYGKIYVFFVLLGFQHYFNIMLYISYSISIFRQYSLLKK